MPYIRARVSDESRDGWLAFTREHGVTISALVESMGLTLANRAGVPTGSLTKFGEDIVRRARDIDNERRRR